MCLKWVFFFFGSPHTHSHTLIDVVWCGELQALHRVAAIQELLCKVCRGLWWQRQAEWQTQQPATTEHTPPVHRSGWWECVKSQNKKTWESAGGGKSFSVDNMKKYSSDFAPRAHLLPLFSCSQLLFIGEISCPQATDSIIKACASFSHIYKTSEGTRCGGGRENSASGSRRGKKKQEQLIDGSTRKERIGVGWWWEYERCKMWNVAPNKGGEQWWKPQNRRIKSGDERVER